jgi:DNA sulfur modification protein DndD
VQKNELYEKAIKDIGATENEIDNIQKTIQGLTITTEKNKKLKKYILYALALFQNFNDEYLKREKRVKEGMEESVNTIFQKMYTGKRIVSITDKYQVVLSAQMANGTKDTDESKGLEVVKNFAFITGLVDLARKKLKSIDKTENVETSETDLPVDTEPYPLVMDAPFSNADELHIRNISKIVPEIAEQVILIVMKKDWEFAKNSLGGRVGKCYEIEKVRNSETNSIIKEAQYDV